MNDAPPIPSQPEGCDCCGFETVNLKAYRLSPMTTKESEDTHKWLCGLCAGTLVGSWHEHWRVCDRTALAIGKVVCYVGNEILREMRKRP